MTFFLILIRAKNLTSENLSAMKILLQADSTVGKFYGSPVIDWGKIFLALIVVMAILIYIQRRKRK
jgi:hypothetical protein